jgi:hypothetical protein
MLVILATQEAEIRKITVRSQPRQIVHETLSQKNSSQKRTDGVAQGTGSEFKPWNRKKKKKKKKKKEKTSSQALVANTCNPSYLGDCEQEDHSSRPTQANSWRDPISRLPYPEQNGLEVRIKW